MEILEFNLTSIVMLLQFVLLAFFLFKFLYQPYLKMTAQRRNQVKEQLEHAEEVRKEAAKMEQTARENLEKTRNQTQKLMEDTRLQSEKILQEAKSRASSQADRMLQQAREEVETMKEQAIRKVRQEAVSLSILMASRILEKQLDEKTQREYLGHFLKKLEQEGREA
ncbi:MAG TPA: F0F1 ATP synthase subunit B [Thermotogota bacterium]|nr:F0F1 ATP synthase subunit B [Thermotogota bacterium]HRW92122.1 F0F1 ATP synthase subunit B [Thermotogota bacterium]